MFFDFLCLCCYLSSMFLSLVGCLPRRKSSVILIGCCGSCLQFGLGCWLVGNQSAANAAHIKGQQSWSLSGKWAEAVERRSPRTCRSCRSPSPGTRWSWRSPGPVGAADPWSPGPVSIPAGPRSPFHVPADPRAPSSRSRSPRAQSSAQALMGGR